MMKLADLDQRRETIAVGRTLNREVVAIIQHAREHLADNPKTTSLAIFSYVGGFLRTIVLDAVRSFAVEGEIRPAADWDRGIWGDFSVMGQRLGVFEPGDPFGVARLRPSYARAVAEDEAPSQVVRDRDEYSFLVRFAEDAGGGAPTAWMQCDDVAYFPWMITYFREIEHIDFTGRRSITDGTAFCSDLGAMAFLKFTHRSFEALLDALQPTSFLDLGCGEGHHVEAALAHPAVSRAAGVEVDPAVAALARKRVATAGGEVFAGDVVDYWSDEPWAMAFACYMLFYMDEEQQVDLLRKVRGLLAPRGVLVICQFLPDFEEYQQVFVSQAAGNGALLRYVGEVSRWCVDAEVLLNRILTHFRTPVYWSTLQKMLQKVGFKVREIIPADPLFYSFYIIAEKEMGNHE